MAVAKSYYSCEDIEGASLENEGGLGTSRYSTYVEFSFCIAYLKNISSHWEMRTLNHEMMNGYISE